MGAMGYGDGTPRIAAGSFLRRGEAWGCGMNGGSLLRGLH